MRAGITPYVHWYPLHSSLSSAARETSRQLVLSYSTRLKLVASLETLKRLWSRSLGSCYFSCHVVFSRFLFFPGSHSGFSIAGHEIGWHPTTISGQNRCQSNSIYVCRCQGLYLQNLTTIKYSYLILFLINRGAQSAQAVLRVLL